MDETKIINIMENSGTYITLKNGEGRKIHFELLDFIAYDMENFAVFLPVLSETAFTVVIVKALQTDENSWIYEPVEDAHTLAVVFHLFQDRFGMVFDFAA